MTTPTNHDAETMRRATRAGAEAHNAVAKAEGASLSYGHALTRNLATNPHDHEGPDSRLHWAWSQGFAWAAQAYGMGRDHPHMPLMCNPLGDFGPFSEAYAMGHKASAEHHIAECELNGIARPNNHDTPGPNIAARLAVAEAVRQAALDELDGDDEALARVQAVADEAEAEHGNPYMPPAVAD